MFTDNKKLQVKPGRYVVVIPQEWRISNEHNDPDMVCKHVAKQMFGDKAKVVGLEHELYADALSMVEKVCEEQGKAFSIEDPVDMVVIVNNEYRYLRVVDARKK